MSTSETKNHSKSMESKSEENGKQKTDSILSRKKKSSHVSTSYPSLDQLKTILDKLKKKENSWPFLEPVDPVALNIPDYFDIIKHPMDLGTVQAKLDSGKYNNPIEALKDIQLIWRNAMTYNEPSSLVYKYAKEMGKYLARIQKDIVQNDSESGYSVSPTTTQEIFQEICDSLELYTSSEGIPSAMSFLDLPSKKFSPEYYESIKNPISINEIRKKQFSDVKEFKEAFQLLFDNARNFNKPSSFIYRSSIVLQKYFVKQLQKYFPDETMVIPEQPKTSSNGNKDQEVDIEKRRAYFDEPDLESGNKRSNRKNYYLSSSEDESEDVDVLGRSSNGRRPAENLIERILADRPIKQGDNAPPKYEYLVKYKGKSYLHCAWVSAEEIEQDAGGKAKLNRYWQKKGSTPDNTFLFEEEKEPDEYFDPQFIELDRIISEKEFEDSQGNKSKKFLCKWKGLSYSEATWEKPEDIKDDKKIEEFKRFNTWKLPSPPRSPDPKNWQKLEKSPKYKNDNQLREYQLEGLNWLTFCWYNRRGSILADEMGLGKTVQAIATLQYLRNRENLNGPSLIVAPLSTIGHWIREFEEWTDLNVVLYQGNRDNREIIRETEFYFLNDQGLPLTKTQYKFNILLTTYEMLLSSDWNELQQISWEVCIIDEAQRLKNSDSKLLAHLKQFRSEHRILLTGTPLQNNMQELWTLLHFIEPIKFSSVRDFMREFGQLEDSTQVAKLHTILRPHLLRRMKEDVEKSIPPKEETLIEVELTSFQKQYYRALLERNRDFLNRGCVGKNVPNLLNVVMQLRKVCNHPFLIKGVEEKETAGKSGESYFQSLVNCSGKLVLLDKLLPKLKETGHKVLIFSQMMKVLSLLETYLQYKGYLYERLDGSIRGNDRQSSIDRFCKPGSDRFVFLLCTRAGGLGINLTAADTVIIYDSDWNPQNDIQAQARCHRIGQTQEVKVYRLITSKTYERLMFERSSKKLGLDQAVLHDMGSVSKAAARPLEKNEIDNLLRYGAYDLFNEDKNSEANNFKEEDIDQILNRSSKVVWSEASVGGQEPSTFSKATFQSSAADSKIDINDPHFWDKVLPEAKTSEKLLEKLKVGFFDTDEKRASFVSDLQIIVYDVFEAFKSGRYEEVALTRSGLMRLFEFLLKSEIFSTFNEDQRSLISSWAEEITKPRRDRKSTSRFMISSESNLYHINSDKLRRKEDPTKWKERERRRFFNAFMSFGPGRWSDIQKRSGLQHRSIEELKEASQEFVKQCIIHAEENERRVFIDCLEAILSENSDAGEIEVELIPEYTKLIKKKLKTWVRQLRLISILNYAFKDGELLDLDFPKRPLTTWWTPAEDRSLLKGLYKHGLGVYEEIRNDPTLTFKNYADKWETPEAKEERNKFRKGRLEKEGEKTEDKSDIKKEIKQETSEEKQLSSEEKDDDRDDDMDLDDDDDMDIEEEKEMNQKSDGTLPVGWPFNRTLDSHAKFLLEAVKKQTTAIERERAKEKKEREKFLRQKRLKEEKQRGWTKREQNEFRNALLIYGPGAWKKIREEATLFKTDEQIDEYYQLVLAKCKKYATEGKKEETSEETEGDDEKSKKSKEEKVKIIDYSITMAKKMLKRMKLFTDLKEKVIGNEAFQQKLELEAQPIDLPTWWLPPIHDKAVIELFSKFGLSMKEWEDNLKEETCPFYEPGDSKAMINQKHQFMRIFIAKDKCQLIQRLEYLQMLATDPEESERYHHKRGRRNTVVGNYLETRSNRMKKRKRYDDGEEEEGTEKSLELQDPNRVKLNLNFKISTRDIERDDDGKPILPFTAKGATILSLGKIIYDRPGYHSKNYLWPVGFKSCRKLPSIHDSKDYVNYYSEILEGENAPIFQVSSEEDERTFQHSTSSGVWCETLKAIKKRSNVSVSGPEMFGYSDPTVKMLIQELPNADKCTSYNWKYFEYDGGNTFSPKETDVSEPPKKQSKKAEEEGESEEDDMEVENNFEESSSDEKENKE